MLHRSKVVVKTTIHQIIDEPGVGQTAEEAGLEVAGVDLEVMKVGLKTRRMERKDLGINGTRTSRGGRKRKKMTKIQLDTTMIQR